MDKKLDKGFFERSADLVAKDLLGKTIIRKIGDKEMKAKIIECEAYFDENDPASWARFGKRKDNSAMWLSGGHLLIKNVHKYPMLNFVTGKEGKAEAVLIRALEPLNFEGRCSGPGLLTQSLGVGRELNGKNLFEIEDILILNSIDNPFEIGKSFRIGVGKDLKKKLRFYVK